MSKIIIYTDGAALGNPGRGGYGAVLMSGKHRKEISEGFELTTNNRMELLAVIKALECIKKGDNEVEIYTDSKYVCDAVEKKWVFQWLQKDFKGKKNSDLWRDFLKLYPKNKIKFNWVKGHAGIKENERCDFLATQMAELGPWKKDVNYQI